MEEQIEEKWKNLISACKAYYIDSIPTGFSDSEYDELEKKALEEDNFSVRDYVFQKYCKGAKYLNSYIEKIKKTKVQDSTMLDAIKEFQKKVGETIYCDLKYDGSSLAIYLDPETGHPKRIVTVGNMNLANYGVDQTWKLMNFIPKKFPLGIVAIQAEALIDIERLTDCDPERARQKANGLINSKNCEDEVNKLLTIRAYRYYCDDSLEGETVKRMNYRDVLKQFDTIRAEDNHILFAPADSFTIEELENKKDYCETDRTITSTGYFLNDGWVLYNEKGTCLGALKYSGAGSSSDGLITTIVNGIQWNNQSSKGKDSWSANVLIDPVVIKGTTIRKPSAGSIGKLIRNNISIGSKISIILANSTIPMVGDVIEQGNGDFQWPTCSCGYKLDSKDIYGSNLKCGRPRCSEREDRMKNYLKSLSDIHKELDLNKYLVIDRFKWENTTINIDKLLNYVEENNAFEYKNYLMSFVSTDLCKKNLELVWLSSFEVLRLAFEGKL